MYCRKFQLRTSSTRTLCSYGNPSSSKFVNKAESGKSNFEKDFEKSHIKTNLFQKVFLGIGSGILSITSPSRGDMVAVMGEVTGYKALEYMRSRMSESNEGKQIIEEKPRISSRSVDLEKLKSYPPNTLGKAYSNFLEKYGYSPDTRNAVQFVDDIELAYIAQRYRETHDLIHTLLDMPTNMLGEVSVKWVEAIQFKLPMCATGALFGAVRLAPKFSRTYSTRIVKLSSQLTEKIQSKALHPSRHPGVMHLPRVTLPELIEKAAKSILSEKDRKNIFREAIVLKRVIAERSLPTEYEERRLLFKEYYNLYKSRIPDFDENDEKIVEKIRAKTIKKIRELTFKWVPIKYNDRTALKYFVGRTAGEYAAVKKVLKEIHTRDENFAPQSLMDFGSGVGSVSWVAHELWGNTLDEYYCVDASAAMNELAAMILKQNKIRNEPFIKNMYFRQFFPATPRSFDIVVSAFSFFDLTNCRQRMQMLTGLWNDTKDYLVLIENGTMDGFRIIAEAREFILSTSKKFNIDCHIFAPCPHELECPRFQGIGKKKPCVFDVVFKKFTFSKANDSDHQKYCYLVVSKKEKPTNERMGRILGKVKKYHKLAVCKVCTNEGEMLDLHVTASKSGETAYKCVRVSNWGDLIPGTLEPRTLAHERKKAIESESISGELVSSSDSDSDSDSVSDSDSDLDSDSDSNSNSESHNDVNNNNVQNDKK